MWCNKSMEKWHYFSSLWRSQVRFYIHSTSHSGYTSVFVAVMSKFWSVVTSSIFTGKGAYVCDDWHILTCKHKIIIISSAGPFPWWWPWDMGVYWHHLCLEQKHGHRSALVSIVVNKPCLRMNVTLTTCVQQSRSVRRNRLCEYTVFMCGKCYKWK